jgi:hypothetical protein
LRERLENWVARREKETGRTNPMYTNLNWHGSSAQDGPFTSSQQAYDTLHIGSVGAANRLQAGNRKKAPAKKRASRKAASRKAASRKAASKKAPSKKRAAKRRRG